MPDHYPKGLTPEDLNFIAQDLETHLYKLHGKRCGFALLVFDFGEGKNSAYVSNANRADMVKALREQAHALERHMDTPPGGQAPGLN